MNLQRKTPLKRSGPLPKAGRKARPRFTKAGWKLHCALNKLNPFTANQKKKTPDVRGAYHKWIKKHPCILAAKHKCSETAEARMNDFWLDDLLQPPRWLCFLLGVMMAGVAFIWIGSQECHDARAAAAYYQSEAERLEYENETITPFALEGLAIRAGDARAAADWLIEQERAGRTEPFYLTTLGE